MTAQPAPAVAGPGPPLSVVLCSLNGATGVERCLQALSRQTVSGLDVIVVDDGSSDDTSGVARRHGAMLVRHEQNRGLSAARNSGTGQAKATIVAFLDDDCVPEPEWAANLLAGYRTGVAGVGGPVLVDMPEGHRNSWLAGFLNRQNPLAPLELSLTKSGGFAYRLWLYVASGWTTGDLRNDRDVYSLVGANMSFRKDVLTALGGFDSRFTFGADELDLCRRLHLQLPHARLRVVGDARVSHVFDPSLKDTIRRSRAYGRGAARLRRKWPSVLPGIYPMPIAAACFLAVAAARPRLLPLALVLPHAMKPAGARTAAGSGTAGALLDAYVQLTQEGAASWGFVKGSREFAEVQAVEEGQLPILALPGLTGPGDKEAAA